MSNTECDLNLQFQHKFSDLDGTSLVNKETYAGTCRFVKYRKLVTVVEGQDARNAFRELHCHQCPLYQPSTQ